MLNVLQIHQQILDVESRTFSSRRWLGGMVVRVAKSHRRFVLFREPREIVNRIYQSRLDYPKSFAHLYQIGVASDEHGCRAEMYYSLRSRAAHPEFVDVRHHVMPYLFLFLFRDGIVNDTR